MSRRRAAAEASEIKTRDELATTADVPDDAEDASFAEAAAPGAAGVKRKAVVLSTKRGGGGGICLSDDEEEPQPAQVASARPTASTAAPATTAPAAPAAPRSSPSGPAADATTAGAAAGAATGATTGATAAAPAAAPTAASAAATTARTSTSMGALLAAMNQPKKKKAKEGGALLMDRGLAELLKGSADVAVDKEAVAAATKAALAATGKMQVAKEVMFAGKSVAVFRSFDKGSDAAEAAKAAQAKAAQQSTLDRVVQELKHPKKAISTVEKTSYDWDKFKEDKGIAEEIERTAAQQSFVDKQAFLNRVDQRTFEVERAERDKARAHAAALAARAEKK